MLLISLFLEEEFIFKNVCGVEDSVGGQCVSNTEHNFAIYTVYKIA